jgi:hypothetical protein
MWFDVDFRQQREEEEEEESEKIEEKQTPLRCSDSAEAEVAEVAGNVAATGKEETITQEGETTQKRETTREGEVTASGDFSASKEATMTDASLRPTQEGEVTLTASGDSSASREMTTTATTTTAATTTTMDASSFAPTAAADWRVVPPGVLSTSPASPITHWKQTVIFLPRPLALDPAHPASVKVTLTQGLGNHRHYNIEMEMVEAEGRGRRSAEHDGEGVEEECKYSFFASALAFTFFFFKGWDLVVCGLRSALAFRRSQVRIPAVAVNLLSDLLLTARGGRCST